jgi:hypothetical protein
VSDCNWFGAKSVLGSKLWQLSSYNISGGLSKGVVYGSGLVCNDKKVMIIAI